MPLVEPVPSAGSVSGAAGRQPDGSLRIVLNPVVDASGKVTASVEASDLSVDVGASFEVSAVAEVTSIPTDLVFVIDTTGSMFWAIDGVKAGVQAFVDLLDGFHFDVRVGGIEFGDEIRTRSPMSDVGAFETWVGKLGVIAGADSPESPLDSMLEAYQTFDFRPGAQRYFILITDAGFHERGDGSGCSDVTLKDVADAMAGRIFFGLVDASASGTPGVAPSEIRRALGGLIEPVEVTVVVSGFDVSVDTKLDDHLGATHVVTIPQSAETDAATEVTVGLGSDAVTLPIEP
jgi:hypothetical protein